METTMKRLCTLMASFALALGLAFALTACGPSDEEQIKEAIDAELGVVVEPTDEELDKLVEEIDTAGLSSQLKSFDIDAKTLVSSWIDGFAPMKSAISQLMVTQPAPKSTLPASRSTR